MWEAESLVWVSCFQMNLNLVMTEEYYLGSNAKLGFCGFSATEDWSLLLQALACDLLCVQLQQATVVDLLDFSLVDFRSSISK